jgi:hypothetical protein
MPLITYTEFQSKRLYVLLTFLYISSTLLLMIGSVFDNPPLLGAGFALLGAAVLTNIICYRFTDVYEEPVYKYVSPHRSPAHTEEEL